MEKSFQNITHEIVLGASSYAKGYSDEELLTIATNMWVDSDEGFRQIRPIFSETQEFIKTVVKSVLQEITSKYSDVTVVTLTLATEGLVGYFTQGHDLTFLTAYRIPLEILAALIYSKVLKEIGNKSQP